MADGAARFAISALSKENMENAISEELIVDKLTGEMLIKTVTGDVISFDKLSRNRAHVNFVSILADNLGVSGDLYSVELDSYSLPHTIPENTNLLSPVQLKAYGLKKLLISVDVDTLTIVPGVFATQSPNRPNITAVLTFKKSGQPNQTITITQSMNDFNQTVTDPKVQLGHIADISSYSCELTSLKITRSTSDNTADVRIILHSVLVVIE